jgi:hypothetical protein
MLHKSNQVKTHKLLSARHSYSKGGLIHTYGQKSTIYDNPEENAKMKNGEIIIEKEIKPKQNYFQRRK